MNRCTSVTIASGSSFHTCGAPRAAIADRMGSLPETRALLGFLALGSGPVTRTRLCNLLWDVPNDPRGELRWCLSKLRSLLDDAERRRVVAVESDRIALDLSDAVVDALEIDRATKDPASLPTERLEELSASFGG